MYEQINGSFLLKEGGKRDTLYMSAEFIKTLSSIIMHRPQLFEMVSGTIITTPTCHAQLMTTPLTTPILSVHNEIHFKKQCMY